MELEEAFKGDIITELTHQSFEVTFSMFYKIVRLDVYIFTLTLLPLH